ncbi:MAG TPA: sporulation integral membrane protein YtvI [Candidatus Limiplasma sp.]|nr:sporulation integral membrane protein YtvI [Candidatus Limiplasma sp.]HPS80749.1 sporulation integral membrane protein YtvI [Candidatus Limiplasma sp.]
MTNLMERLAQWNETMNGLPRKAMLIAVTLLLTWLFILLAPLCWPFILALLFSMALEPLVRFCLARVKRPILPRGLITLLGMVVLFGVLGVALFMIVNRLIHELMALVHSTPVFVNWLSNTVVPTVRNLYQQYSDVLPPTVMSMVNNGLASIGDSAVKLAGTLSGALTSGAVNAAAAIPGLLLSVVLTVMGTYYMTADRERILAFFRRTFPASMQKHSLLLKRNLFRSLFGQVKSQLTVSMIIISFLVLSFVIYGVKYGLLFGFLIGVADALPVIGAGLFLIPWSILELILSHYPMGIFLALVYVGTIVIRQISEPRIVGANLGLYPLATMIAMFAGYQLMGFLGLLAGPILLNLIKVVLEADDVANGVAKGRKAGRFKGRCLPSEAEAEADEDAAPGA